MTEHTQRFDELFTEAFDGLREYYPSVLTEDNRAELKENVRESYRDTGDSQADYEILRDAVEISAKALETDLPEDTPDDGIGLAAFAFRL